jgi:hypothetical protein
MTVHPDVSAIFRRGQLGQVSSTDHSLTDEQASTYTLMAEGIAQYVRPALLEALFEGWASPVSLALAFDQMLPNLPDAVLRRLLLAMLIRNSTATKPNERLAFAPSYMALVYGDAPNGH